MSMADAARIKGVSYHTVSRAVRSGRLPVTRVGRMALIRRTDLDSWEPLRNRAPKQYRREPFSASSESRLSLLITDTEKLSMRLGLIYDQISQAAVGASANGLLASVMKLLAEAFALERVAVWQVDFVRRKAVRIAHLGPVINVIPDDLDLNEVWSAFEEDLNTRPTIIDGGNRNTLKFIRMLGVELQGPLLLLPLRIGGMNQGAIFADRSGKPLELSAELMTLAEGIGYQVSLAMNATAMRDTVRTQRAMMQEMIEQIDGAVSVYDKTGQMMMINAEEREMFDLHPEFPVDGANLRDYDALKHRYDMRGFPLNADDIPSMQTLSGRSTREQRHIVVGREGERQIAETRSHAVRIDDELVGAITISRDISATMEPTTVNYFQQLEHALRRSQAMADIILEINDLRSSTDTDTLARSAVQRIAREFRSLGGIVMLADARGVFQLRAATFDAMSLERFDDKLTGLRQTPHVLRALRSGRPQIVPIDQLDVAPAFNWLAAAVTSALIIPMVVRHRMIGYVALGFCEPVDLSSADLDFAALWGRQCAQAMEKARLFSALEAATEQLLAIVNQLPQGIVLCNSETGLIRLANDAADQLWGFRLGDGDRLVVELPVRSLDGERLEDEHHPLARSVNRGEHRVGDMFLVERPDGTTVEVVASHTPLVDEHGAVTGAVCVLQPRSDFAPLDRARNEFISVIAHELRNPMTSLRGNLQLMKRRRLNDQDREHDDEAERIESVIQQVDRMSELVNRMLDVSRVDSDRLHVDPKPCDAIALIREVLDEARGLGPSVRITFSGPATLPVVWDQPRIQQVLVNLMQNAVRYAPGSPIDVTATLCPGHEQVEIRVRDYGPGVPKRLKQRLFRQYYRFDDGEASERHELDASKGLGIGLYISARLAKSHGGSLTVDDAEGGGALFTLHLPRDGRLVQTQEPG